MKKLETWTRRENRMETRIEFSLTSVKSCRSYSKQAGVKQHAFFFSKLEITWKNIET